MSITLETKDFVMDSAIRDKVANATVSVVADEAANTRGRGFVVHGGFILTAAHCLPWSGKGEMALGDSFFVKVITPDNQELVGTVVAVEPVSDIGVIAAPDHQQRPEEFIAFQRYCLAIEPPRLCLDELESGQEFPAVVYSHKNEWIFGQAAQQFDNAPKIIFETNEPILGGTSGSAIVNTLGEIIGVVSNSDSMEPTDDVNCESEAVSRDSRTQGARPSQALPSWVLREIIDSQNPT